MVSIRKYLLLLLLLLVSGNLMAANAMYSIDTYADTDQTYDTIYQLLEDEKFWVVFQTNIGNNLKHFEKKWGNHYNRNNLTAIRSILVCNPWWANLVSNEDPMMLAFCPQHITVIARNGITSVLYSKPSVYAGASPAKPVLEKIEETIIGAIERAVKQVEKKHGSK